MNPIDELILKEVKENHGETVALRRLFHRHPELAAQEEWTAAQIEAELDRIGLTHERFAGTGVLCEITGQAETPVDVMPGGKPRCLVLRADIDGLPEEEQHTFDYRSENLGRMHACGHDAHTASLISTAKLLAAHRDLFSGKIILTWQPGEEVGYGARILVDSGRIDEGTRSFGLHMAPYIPVGKVLLMPGANNASVDWFRITVHGTGAHVSKPHQGADAAYIAAQIVVGAQALVTRLSNPIDSLLIGIGKIEAGTAYNIIAETAVMEGTIRSLNADLREKTKARLRQLVEQTAELFGAKAQIEYRDNTSVLYNDEKSTREAQQTASDLFGTENVVRSWEPSLGGDDMAEYILRVPGCFAYIGSGNPERPDTVLPLHHSCFDIDEEALLTSVALTAGYALHYMRGELDEAE